MALSLGTEQLPYQHLCLEQSKDYATTSSIPNKCTRHTQQMRSSVSDVQCCDGATSLADLRLINLRLALAANSLTLHLGEGATDCSSLTTPHSASATESWIITSLLKRAMASHEEPRPILIALNGWHTSAKTQTCSKKQATMPQPDHSILRSYPCSPLQVAA